MSTFVLQLEPERPEVERTLTSPFTSRLLVLSVRKFYVNTTGNGDQLLECFQLKEDLYFVEIDFTTFAGGRNPNSSLVYLHLPKKDLSVKSNT